MKQAECLYKVSRVMIIDINLNESNLRYKDHWTRLDVKWCLTKKIVSYYVRL